MNIPTPPLFLRRCVALPLIVLDMMICIAMALVKLVIVFLVYGPDGIRTVFAPKSIAHIKARDAYSERETKHIRKLWS